ncbi:MAG: hypothetical protein ABW174_00115 [Flavitalea sp.]
MSFYKLIALSFVLVIVGCNKRGSGRDAEPSDPSMYRLSEIRSAFTNSDQDEIYTINYNTDNQVSEIKWVFRAPGGTGANPSTIEHTVTFSLTYQNNLAVQCIRKAEQEIKTITYQYDGNRVRSKLIKSNMGPQIDSTIYHYGPDGKPTEVFTYHNDRFTSRVVFTYTNDVTTIVTYVNEFSGETKAKFEYAGYDSNTNFMRAITGLPALPGVTDFPFTRDVSLSPNNHKNQKAYSHVGINDEFKTPWLNLNISYEYNNAGLPTIMKLMGGQYFFRYHIIR